MGPISSIYFFENPVKKPNLTITALAEYAMSRVAPKKEGGIS
jgi:hypothetical protein